MAGPALTWSLVIATYNRGTALRRCVGSALGQTRPPREVIVVDASTNWEENEAFALQPVRASHPEIRWEYEPARVRSLTIQRNQGLEKATTNVLFLIDDDSYMYPDCAAEILSIYEADPGCAVAGVGATLLDRPPSDDESPVDESQTRATARGRSLRRLLVRPFDVEALLLPYDECYPDRPIPPAVQSLGAIRCRYLHGMRMTYRREFIQKERFDDFLQRYAAGEDLDTSYRVSRHGALVAAPRARIYHAQDPAARLTRYTRNTLGLLNLAVLYRLKGHDPGAMLETYGRRVRGRLSAEVLRDLARGRLRLPCTRAAWNALVLLDRIRDMDATSLRAWYLEYQRELVERNPS